MSNNSVARSTPMCMSELAKPCRSLFSSIYCMAALRERAIPARMMIAQRLSQLNDFFPDCVRSIKVDGFSRHVLAVRPARPRPARTNRALALVISEAIFIRSPAVLRPETRRHKGFPSPRRKTAFQGIVQPRALGASVGIAMQWRMILMG